MAHPAFRFAQVSGQHVDWSLRRNSSLTSIQLAWLYGSLCLLSLAIGLWCWQRGAHIAIGFASLELLALGIAFFVYARHASDGERIQLRGARLVVELEQAGRKHRAEFNRAWLRVEPKASDGSLIRLSGQGRSVDVGRYVRPELRAALASEIRLAVRGA